MQLFPLCISLLLLAPCTDAANILCLVWFIASSHFVMFERLFKELAARGHNVTVLSHFPQKTPIANYHDISVAGSLTPYEDEVTLEFVEYITGPMGIIDDWKMMVDMCHQVYKHPQAQQLVRSQDQYDLVITEIFYGDCMAVFAHKFRAPLVGIISSMSLAWAYDRMGNPDNPAYMESYHLPYSAPFNFRQRLEGTITYIGCRLANWWLADRQVDTVVNDIFGEEQTSSSEVVHNTSLVLVNTHWSTGSPVPTVPAFVEVGGLHIKEPKPLPQDLQKFLDDSHEGVVYFSLGSMVRVDSFTPEKLRAVLDVFSALPQGVLWKVDPSKLPEMPPNVMARKWMPQNDVLNHRNVRVFITHSGMMGTQEALAAGVPMLAIPMFGDQFLNADRAVSAGNGIKLLYAELSHESLRTALDQLLNDKRYRDRAQQLSVLFRDRPRPPLEEAVYWVEYVLRHGGAPHLRSAALDLAWYQYLLLDVAAFVVLAATLVVLVIYLLLRRVLSHFNKPVSSTPKLKAS